MRYMRVPPIAEPSEVVPVPSAWTDYYRGLADKVGGEVGKFLLENMSACPHADSPSWSCPRAAPNVKTPLLRAIATPCALRLCPGHGAPKAPEDLMRWVVGLTGAVR
jgi:hypothetical protein